MKEQFIFFDAEVCDDSRFYISDENDSDNTSKVIMWTPFITKAKKFNTKEEFFDWIEKFKMNLGDLVCLSIFTHEKNI